MLRPFIPTLLLAIQFFFLSNPASAQSSMPSSSCPCTVRGSVVDSVSGQPVPHALVNLSGTSSRAALTDSEGKFQFEGLPAGSAIVEAEKPGYLTQDPIARWYPTSAQFQLAPDNPPALLKLIPEGVIFGQVSDENGEPLEGFTFSLFLRGPGHRGLGLGPGMLHHPVITDDQGKFRIAGLHPASYYLALRQPQGAVPSPSRKSVVPTGYAPVFYPGVNEMSAAVPLKVRPGTSIQANFSLKRVPFIRLSGTVSGYASSDQVRLVLENSSGLPENSEIIFDNATGLFHTIWIPPGVYRLVAQTADLAADAAGAVSFAGLHVNATSNLSNLRLALQPTTNIPANVRIRSSGNSAEQQPPVVLLFLNPRDTQFINSAIPFVPSAQPESPRFSRDSVGVFPGVRPGTYELTFAIGAPSSCYYLDSATWGSADLLRDDLVFDSSGAAPPIEVLLRDDAATLNGSVILGDPPVEATVAVLSGRGKPRFLSVGSNGKFTFPALPPGVYSVFAIDGSANVDYQDPAFLAKVSSKIQEITLSPQQSASITLELATVEE